MYCPPRPTSVRILMLASGWQVAGFCAPLEMMFLPAMVMVQRRVSLSSGSNIRSGASRLWCLMNLL